MAVIAAYMVPHPPMIIPQVGRGSEKQITETIRAYQQVADEIAERKPEAIIISSPHAILYADYFHISPGKKAAGDFSRFRAPDTAFQETYDTELVREICDLADRERFPAGTLGERDRQLDHGTMVPLYFVEQKYRDFRLVRIGLSGLSLAEHYAFGQLIRQAADRIGRRTVYIASGDLSHKLQEYGPYGFAPEGPEYDRRVMDACSRGAFGELLAFDEAFCDKAAECGHRSFVMMAGVLDGMNVEARQLSHQDVTGVGYGICSFYPAGESADRKFLDIHRNSEKERLRKKREKEDPFVRLARLTVESYVRDGKKPEIPEWTTEEMRNRKAGVFVSIHEEGKLRGCIGTILPTRDSIAEEIISNAVSAAVRDPRFSPIRPDELQRLEINVDVLTEPEVISSREELDVRRYGVIVSSGHKRGLLLPDLDGVDTVDDQIGIAMRKGGITDRDAITLERFEVVRHV